MKFVFSTTLATMLPHDTQVAWSRIGWCWTSLAGAASESSILRGRRSLIFTSGTLIWEVQCCSLEYTLKLDLARLVRRSTISRWFQQPPQRIDRKSACFACLPLQRLPQACAASQHPFTNPPTLARPRGQKQKAKYWHRDSNPSLLFKLC